MWLNGDDGTVNFDIGTQYGQIVKINPNGRMNGLTDGQVSAGSTDAVTGNQLFALQSKVEQIGSGGGTAKYFHANSTAADSSATGGEAIAIGPVAKGTGYNSIALGNSATAGGQSGIAIGSGAVTEADWTFAAGNAAVAKASGDVALGASALANGSGQWSTALGTQAQATATQSTAVGANAQAKHHYSVALGQASTTDRTNSVSVGNASWQRQVTFVAKGTQGTDAVNVDQLKGVTTALGGGAGVDATTGAVKAPTYNVAGGSYTNVGAALAAVDAKAGSGGGSSKYFHTNTTLADSVTTGADSIAIGGNAASDGKWSLAAGTNAKATADNSVALGNSSLADRANSVSVGSATVQRQIINVAKGTLGTDAVNVDQLNDSLSKLPFGKNAVSYDGDDHLQVTLNPGGAPTRITNVADGKVEAGSKDAVNGDQLFKVEQKVGEIGPKLKYIKFGMTTAADAQSTGQDSTAIGGNAFANANGALALGTSARASAVTALAAGSGSLASGDNSVALGGGAMAKGANTVALGSGSSVASGDSWVVSVGNLTNKRRITNLADGVAASDAATVGQVDTAISKAFAAKTRMASPLLVTTTSVSKVPVDQLIAAGETTLGGQIQAEGINTLAIGLNTHATAENAVAAGQNVAVGSKDSVGVGQNIAINGERAVAIGSKVSAIAADAAVFGTDSSADADSSVAIGAHASVVAAATDSVVIGRGTQALAKGTVVLGQGSTDDNRTNTVSVGSTLGTAVKRQVINVAKGTLGTDAVNVDQLKGVTAALGGSAGVNADGTIKAPSYTVQGQAGIADVGTALGKLDTATTANTTIINNITNGSGIKYFHSKSTLADSTATGNNSVAVGGAANATGISAIAIGSTASAAADWTFAAGNAAAAKASGDTALGASAQADGAGTYSTALGTNAQALATQATAVGAGAKATHHFSVALGQDSTTDRINSVSVGNASWQRQLTFVAKGTKGTDAVNVDQLKGVTAALGGTAGVDPTTGNVTAPAYKLDKGTVTATDVGAALANIDGRVTNVMNGTAGLVQQAAAGANLTVGKDTDGVAVVFNAKNGATRQLKGLTDGVDNNDAVNVQQLNKRLSELPTNPNAVSYDGNDHLLLTLNAGKDPTKITNVAEGKVESGSKDAVTGGQLFKAVDTITTAVSEIAPKLKYIKFGATTAMDAQATGPDSTAIGGNAFANGTAALALGASARASGNNALASGSGSLASADGAVALGNGARAQGANSVALGGGSSVASGDSWVVSVGNLTNKRRITNLADGVAASDAATVGQVDTAISKAFAAKTRMASPLLVTTQTTSVSKVPVDQLIAAGETTLGGQIQAEGINTLAIGLNTHATAENAVAAGQNVAVGSKDSVGVGQNIAINGERAVAIGSKVSAIANDAAVFGTDSSADADSSVAIGAHASVVAAATDSVAIGRGTEALAKGTVVLGQGSTDDSRANTVSVGSTLGTAVKRQVINVAKGTLDNDAVNVSQLKDALTKVVGGTTPATIDKDGNVTAPTFVVDGKDTHSVGEALGAVEALAKTGSSLGVAYDDATKTKVTLNNGGTTGPVTITNLKNGIASADAINMGQLKPVIDGLGGGAKVDPTTGVVTGPTYNITKVDGTTTTVNNVGDAITNIDGRVTNIIGGKAGLVQQAAAGEDLTVGKDTDGVGVNFAGTAGVRLLRGVSAGKADTDAVNVSQLKGVTAAIGGGAAVKPDGSIDPGFTIGGTKYASVAEAVAAVDAKTGTGNALGVAYDDTTKTKVTLNKGGTTGPVTIANVKDGVANDEAVNVAQLKATGIIDPTGKALDAVVYDANSNKASVSFGGATGTVLRNVAAGVVSSTSKEAINGSQLYGASQSVAAIIGGGVTVDKDGKVTAPAGGIAVGSGKYDDLASALNGLDGKIGTGNPLGVAYDDTTKTKVTLNNGGTTGPVTITNVKNGIAPADAINLGQLKPVIDGLGGGATVDPTTGVVTGPTYNITKIDGTTTTVHTVGDAITNIDGRTTQNTTNITNVLSGKAGLVQQAAAGDKLTVGKDTDGTEVNFTGKAGDRKLSGVAKGTADNDAVNVKQLKDAGLVDGNGNVANAVTYDSAAKDSVTLGNAGKAVTLKNVANATKDDEAINLGQLRSTGLVGENGKVLDAVVYDAGSNKASVTFGGINGTVLNNVADGRIEAGSRQAINGGQIAAIKSALEGKITNIDNRVTTIEQHGGGGGGNPAYVTANGIGGSPKPANAGDSAGVAVGFDTNASGLGASAIGDHATAAGIDSVAIGNNASTNATGANSVALGNGSVADRANTVSVGSEGHERTISNVARGSRETDAVNVGLLDERVRDLGTSANAYTDKMVNDVWSNLKEEIDHSNRQANRGIAAASALINVTPYVPGHVTVNAGVAGYRGESALGVGVSRWSENGRINLNAGVSAAQGDEPVYRVGIGYIF